MSSSVTDRPLRDSLDSMILSASGWRKVFAPDGDHGTAAEPTAVDGLLAVGMGVAWGEWLHGRVDGDYPRVLVATDTRPTGPSLARSIICGLKSRGCYVRYTGVAAAPEAMARCERDEALDAFAYISASHNPLGHNGVKFGLGGGVIGGADAKELIAEFRALIEAPGAAARLDETARTIAVDRLRSTEATEKRRCLADYRSFLLDIAGGPGNDASRTATLEALRESLAEHPVRIIADLNGSARCVSADRVYLEDLGAVLDTFNDRPGDIVHAILPEGESLEPCRSALEAAHAKDPAALIGYVPDNDGDRGNLVIWDESIAGARALEAQEVFALSALAELAAATWGDAAAGKGAEGNVSEGGGASAVKSALVVNGPTSHRVRDIAAAYGAEVHEAEVGEANVVNRAAELRAQGYRVRLLGEGSNGGTITHPAAVRDPLNTVTALLKLLRLPPAPDRPAPFEDWCRRIGRPEAYHVDFGPADIVATLPLFTTTPTSEPRALAAIETRDHGALKSAWEDVFGRQWSLHKNALHAAYGFVDWYEVNNEGTQSRVGVGPSQRTGAATGGLKVVFRDSQGRDAGFLWMRGSGTEPVFRVMAEIRGDNPKAERALASWQGGMVAAADRIARGKDADEGNLPSPV